LWGAGFSPRRNQRPEKKRPDVRECYEKKV
jgi:hypothetical protein